MKFNEKQEQLLEFVKARHGSQMRKSDRVPYWTHLVSVAALVAEYEKQGIEAALCHDLLEDTDCTEAALEQTLRSIGYDEETIANTLRWTVQLTDMYTKEAYPDWNRQKRKSLEARRLGTIDPMAQSIKYCDLRDNCRSIVGYDRQFASVWLEEHIYILHYMRAGNVRLLINCCHTLKTALDEIAR